jgi:hypothetical protein
MVILWNEFLFKLSRALSAQHKNLYHVQKILPGLGKYPHSRAQKNEKNFSGKRKNWDRNLPLKNDARSNHQREFRGKPAPEIIAIRKVEIRYLT